MTSEDGFTLVELVVVIAVTALVGGLIASFIARPLEAYQDVSRRAVLVDAAESAVRRLARDLRRALPNSVRVSGAGLAIEFLDVADGARYRQDAGFNVTTAQNHTVPADTLEFSGDTSWNVLGTFGALAFTYGVPLAGGHRVAVYPTGGAVWTDAAAGANPGVITPAGTNITVVDDVDEDQVQLSAAHQFSFASPQRRFYVVEQPVSYLCDTAAGTLTRYAPYTIAAAQPTDPSIAPLVAAPADRLAERIAACAFTYQPGTTARAGLATVELQLVIGTEQVRVFNEVHVVNVP